MKSLKAKDPETGKLLYDKTFADAVQRMNRWSFPLEVAGFVTYDEETKEFSLGEKTVGKSGQGWVDLATALMATQAFADAKEMMGTDYGTEENRDLYSAGQSALAEWVRQHAKNIPAWGKQWNNLKEEYGDVLIGTVFMPDKYFGHLGEVDD